MLEPNCIQSIPSFPRLTRLRQLLLIALSTSTLTGCPVAADLENPERFDLADAGLKDNSCITPALKRSCWGIGCHGSDTPAAMLDMQSPDVASRLVNVDAAHTDILDGSEGNCLAGEKRINTSSVEDSAIIKKINGKQSCGGKMPVAPRTLSEADKQCICEWVYELAGVMPGANYCTGMGTASAAGGAGGMAGSGGSGGSAGATGGAGSGGGGAGGTAGGGTGGGGTGGGGTGGGGTGGTAGGGTGGV